MLDYLQIKKDKYSMELTERVEELEIEIGDLQSEIDRLFESQGNTEEQITNLSQQIITINSQLEELKKQIEDTNTRIDECDTQIEDIKEEHIRDIAALEEKVMEVRNDITSINNEISALKQKDIEIDRHLENTDKNVETNTNQITELTKQISNKRYIQSTIRITKNKINQNKSGFSYSCFYPDTKEGNFNPPLFYVVFTLTIDISGYENYLNLNLTDAVIDFASSGLYNRFTKCTSVYPLKKVSGSVSLYEITLMYVSFQSWKDVIINDLYLTFFGVT